MQKPKTTFISLFSFALSFTFLQSCSYTKSPKTGWDYNNPINGGFQKVTFFEQETGPGLALIVGGDHTIALSPNSESKELTVRIPSFYMDITEVTNQDWQEYLYWTKRTFGNDFEALYLNALPDTSCWKETVGNYQGFTNDYLRHPAYKNYPVVGVSWMQANNYCAWRTDRVNEYILIREGILVTNPMQQNEPFTTDAYLNNQYDLGVNEMGQMPDRNPSRGGYDPTTGKFEAKNMATRNVRMEDGIMLPRYRLPTEAEWEYASSYGVDFSSKSNKKIHKSWKKQNNQFGYQDNWASQYCAYQNPNSIVVPVNSYLPNDAGLYNMHSNISEWVADVHQDRTLENTKLFSPLADHSQLKIKPHQANSSPEQKYTEVIYDVGGLKAYMQVFEKALTPEVQYDSVFQLMFSEIDNHINEASILCESGGFEDASIEIRIILYETLEDYHDRYKSLESWKSVPNAHIFDEIRRIISKFALFYPGQMPVRDQTPEETIRRRNINNTTDWVTDYDEKLDSLALANEDRVVKGASFIHPTTSQKTSFRFGTNKYEASCYIGFRCAMDRVGTPFGLGEK